MVKTVVSSESYFLEFVHLTLRWLLFIWIFCSTAGLVPSIFFGEDIFWLTIGKSRIVCICLFLKLLSRWLSLIDPKICVFLAAIQFSRICSEAGRRACFEFFTPNIELYFGIWIFCIAFFFKVGLRNYCLICCLAVLLQKSGSRRTDGTAVMYRFIRSTRIFFTYNLKFEFFNCFSRRDVPSQSLLVELQPSVSHSVSSHNSNLWNSGLYRCILSSQIFRGLLTCGLKFEKSLLTSFFWVVFPEHYGLNCDPTGAHSNACNVAYFSKDIVPFLTILAKYIYLSFEIWKMFFFQSCFAQKLLVVLRPSFVFGNAVTGKICGEVGICSLTHFILYKWNILIC